VTHFQLKKQAQEQNETGNFSSSLVTVLDPSSTASEAYRALRTSLLYAVQDAPSKVILITSPGSVEGKSTTCANLGVVLAQADRKTLIIDGNLRDPSVHDIFGIDNFYGLVDILSDRLTLSEAGEEPLSGLEVVSSGPTPSNQTELLSSGRFAELIDQARQLFDYVLIDSPAMESVSDPTIIATQADAVLLVLDSGTRQGPLLKAVRELEAIGANILGTVMNNLGKTKNGH
jgi:capsular exopolysaccharide synthesis family protein